MFLFWPVVQVLLGRQYPRTYRQGKFKSKIMIFFLPGASDVFISSNGKIFSKTTALP